MRRPFAVALALLIGLALAAAAAALLMQTKLTGTTGPGFTITLRDAQGQNVTRVDPGPFEIEVDDRSAEHNFHLTGPGGVDVATPIETVGKQTFTVSLVEGRYTFQCDPHAASMRGTFQVGNAPPETQPPPQPRPQPSAPVGARLALTVGPSATISLKTLAGKKVTLLRPGAYTFLVRDRSRNHNAHLLGEGAGASRATGVGFVGQRTWRVVLRNGTLVIRCDPHRTAMRTTVRIAA